MQRIAICDDDPAFCGELADMIRRYYNETFSLELFRDGVELLCVIEEQLAAFDLFILDIRMPIVDGLRAAKEIRQRDESVPIILVTNYREHVFEGYDVQALQYLMKPLEGQRFRDAFDRALEIAGRRRKEEILYLSSRGFEAAVPLRDILYMESFGHKLRICTAEQEWEVNHRIGEMESRLQEAGFFRIHKSYLINLRHFHYRDGEDVYLHGGRCLRISKTKIPALVLALQRRFEREGWF